MSWPLNHQDFEDRHKQKRWDKAINVIALGFGFSVFLLFVWNFIAEDPFARTLREWLLTPNITTSSLFLTVLSMCFVVYRGVRMSVNRIPVSRQTSATVDIVRSFAPEMETVLATAHDLAKQTSAHTVHTVHLFIASFTTRPVANLMWRLGLDLQKLRPDLLNIMQSEAGERVADPEFSIPAREVIFEAFALAQTTGREWVTGLEVVLCAAQKDPAIMDALRDAGVQPQQLQNAAAWIRGNDDLRNWQTTFQKAAASRPGGAMNRSMTSIATPLLDRFCTDITMSAQRGALPPLIGREQEMENIVRIMESGRQSVVLVGPNGVGKRALVNGLAINMVLERVPQILADKRLLELSIPTIVAAGGSAGADAEQVLLALLAEAGNAGNVILTIPHVSQLSGAGGANGIDLLATFAAEMQKGYIVCIGTATPEEYAESLERSSLGAQMQKVSVQEVSTDQAIRVLQSKVGTFEYEFDVAFTYAAVEAAVMLTDRYDHERLLPGKAIEVAREAALQVSKTNTAQKASTKSAQRQSPMVDVQDIAALVSQKTNITVTQVTANESAKLLNLEAEIGKRVIGQLDAVKAVSAALRRARAELRSGTRPMGSFLFLGPTGVGKTELSKAVAQVYFGAEQSMIRLDMSEYQDANSVNRLIGTPGSAKGGVLTEAIRKQPYALLLCDEIEKAHPDILNLFLQIMDDGRLTDATGRTVDFTNSIIIMTSNAGTQTLQDALKQNTPLEDIKKQLLETDLKQTYRPEFLNRFDEIILFRPLTLVEATKIAELMILQFANTLEGKGIDFHASESAIANLAKKGYDPLFGARPMRRVIQDTLENDIANLLLQQKLTRGDTAILTDLGTVEVEKKHLAA